MADLSFRDVLVIAGEASGDLHASRVVSALGDMLPGLRVFGLGGQELLGQQLDLLAKPDCLNLVGLSEVIGSLGRVLALRKSILKEVDRRKPKAALLVDLPGFNLNLAYHLKKRSVKVVYYIAPQAWAWRKGRVRKIRDRVDELCVIFPFEEEFFKAQGINARFVGHPLMEDSLTDDEMATGSRTLALVPGSRPAEIRRLLPPMAKAARILQDRRGPLDMVLPVAPGIDRSWVERILRDAGVKASLLSGTATDALRRARAAFVTSGTATLEAAMCGVPMVVVYRVSSLSYAMVKPIYRLKYFCIVNILANGQVVPELLQGSVEPQMLADQLEPMMDDGPVRRKVVEDLAGVVAQLQGPKPSVEVAKVLTRVMEAKE